MSAAPGPARVEPVLIAGAGLAGLCAAIGLLRAGIYVRVLEQAPVLAEVGAGVSLAPNATRALAWLGVLDAVRAIANVPLRAAIKHWRSAEEMSGYSMGPAMQARWGSPYLQILRADLHGVLADAVRRYDAQALVLGARVQRLVQDADGVSVSTTAGEFRGRALVGADGVRSAVRAALHGEGPPPFLGYVAWRGTMPAARLGSQALDPDTAVFIGPGQSLLRYRVRGQATINAVAFARHEAWTEEGWSQPADVGQLRAAFDGWADEAVALIDGLCREGAFKWGLFGRPQLARWQRGRVTLIGDAAHPMLPFLGQGAAMAIEDGVLVARACAEVADVESALAAFEAARYVRTTDTVRRADRQGLLLHGHPFDDTTPVPRDDFAEYGYDVAAVPLQPATA